MMLVARLRFSWPLLVAATIVAAGCGGSLTEGGFSAPGQAHAASAGAGDLLYVATAENSNHYAAGGVSIFAFPQLKAVAEISGIGSPAGLCSDASGNVWVLAVADNAWNAYEYAHGGTTPVAEIPIRNPNVVWGCAVDPTTGNLAVFTGVDGHGVKRPAVVIYPGARNVKPVKYPLALTPTSGAYDPNGNLFVDGYVGGNEQFDFAELAKGAKSFAKITINRHTEFPGGVEWDGSYIAVDTGGLGRRAVIYRLSISRRNATVVGTVVAKELSESVFAVGDGTVAATSGRKVLLWAYPQGGQPSKFVLRFHSLRGLTVSLAGTAR
jgi:hypothetical protein